MDDGQREPRVSLSSDELSELRLVLDIEGQPDTENRNLPGGKMVRPRKVVVLIYFEDDRRWKVGLINVIGPRVHRTSGALTKRDYEVPFMNPMDDGSLTPGWVERIGQSWENRMNGV